MRWINNLIAGLKSLLHRGRVERELDEELDSYVQASIADKQHRGMTAEQARRAALVELGSSNAVKHQVWTSRWEGGFDGLLQDVRFGMRTLLKSPGFTAVAVLSIALGIGGNTAIFTLIHQVFLLNLPVNDPQSLVTFDKSDGGGVLGGVDLGSYGMFPWSFARKLQTAPGPFQGIASYGSFAEKVSVLPPSIPGEANVAQAATLVPAVMVSGNYFSVLGAQALLGRTIEPADDATPGSGAVAVLSHHLWQQMFSANPGIVGQTITINRSPFQVIGVMPEQFQGIKLETGSTGMWTPVSMQPVILQQPSFLTPEGGPYFLHMFGRLTPQAAATGSGFAQAQEWLDNQVRTQTRANEGSSISPARQQEINRITVPLISAQHGVSSLRSRYGGSLTVLMVVVVLVLLIACANLANFLLARTTTRRRETATRLALGSSRARIIRQNLVETLLLSLMGGGLGLAFAFAGTRALIAFVSRGNGYTSLDATPDAAVLIFTLGISLFTGLLFGLAPAILASRGGASTALNSGARTAQADGGGSSRLWARMLVTAQIMLSLVLLVEAGVFLRSLRSLQHQDYGFERTHLLIAEFNAKLAGYHPSQTNALHQQLIERLSALPGVQSVAIANARPIQYGHWSSTVTIPGYTPAPKENMVSILNRVSPRYFETAGIQLVAGRPITSEDSATSPKAAVVNQTFASHFFPKGDAIGRTVAVDIDTVKGPWTIVGIVRDTKSDDPHSTNPIRMTYLALEQIEPLSPLPAPDPSVPSAKPANETADAAKAPREENQDRFATTILVRTTGDPANTVTDLRRAVASVNPNLPLLEVTTIHDQVSGLLTNDELVSSLTGIFSVLALLLAAIGLYGVMSYNVVRRTNEIGIRFALGAPAPAVLWMILRESLLLLGIGMVIGAPLAFAATRAIRGQLFTLETIDPSTFLAAVAVIAAMTLFAAWLPARRATRVDPMVALRCD
ncbi:MAG TPA: ABC transporter permease [Acidobacteriaceae bacterium]|jgi:predicted permease